MVFREVQNLPYFAKHHNLQLRKPLSADAATEQINTKPHPTCIKFNTAVIRDKVLYMITQVYQNRIDSGIPPR
jgi:hypothetical protein